MITYESMWFTTGCTCKLSMCKCCIAMNSATNFRYRQPCLKFDVHVRCMPFPCLRWVDTPLLPWYTMCIIVTMSRLTKSQWHQLTLPMLHTLSDQNSILSQDHFMPLLFHSEVASLLMHSLLQHFISQPPLPPQDVRAQSSGILSSITCKIFHEY